MQSCSRLLFSGIVEQNSDEASAHADCLALDLELVQNNLKCSHRQSSPTCSRQTLRTLISLNEILPLRHLIPF